MEREPAKLKREKERKLFGHIKTTAQSVFTHVHSMKTEQTLSPLVQMNVNIQDTKNNEILSLYLQFFSLYFLLFLTHKDSQ